MAEKKTPLDLDLPLVVEATNELCRELYAHPELGPVFKGVNMIVLRRHVSYFLFELTTTDAPMTERQIDYLREVHIPIIAQRGVNRRHFDTLVAMLVGTLKNMGAPGSPLLRMQSKLRPLREMFPVQTVSVSSSSVDGEMLVHEHTAPHQQHSSSSAPVKEAQADEAQQPDRPMHEQQQTAKEAVSMPAAVLAMGHMQQQQQHHYHCEQQQHQKQQQQHAVPASLPAPTLNKDAAASCIQQQLQNQEQENHHRGNMPLALKKTKLWWKRLLTTVKSH